ncbi:DNA repair protein RadC [Paenibacillus yanchengensis]|uniref:DNA repair protein RadC n=1 Tax=Paenibacillus yanchengensis TaxID=2035833 RepID=A0ABW4YLZ7_9BACL
MLMKDIPSDERPRERLVQYGSEVLSHIELLAILLRTGTKQQSVMQLATKILTTSNGIHGLVDMTLEELMSVKGIGEAKAVQVLAGIELGKRLGRSKWNEDMIIRKPQDAAHLMMSELRHLPKEHFVCLFLNTKNYVIAKETMSIGTLNATLVHPRDVFRSAIKHNSASFICLHNHPSGDPAPSREDISLTTRLVETGKLVGIELLDHIIIGDGRFVSLKEQGHL